ncbi:MAG: hypothetical protein VB138_11185, partial [Burkholderia sp.]
MNSHPDHPADLAAIAPAASAASNESPGELRRNTLNLPELIAQSIGLVGVSGGIGVLIPAVASTPRQRTRAPKQLAIVAQLLAT